MALLKRKRTGLSDPMSVVTSFVNACNRHDAEGVSACLHPDFDSIQPMYPSRNFRGADQVRRNWQAIFDAEPGFRLTVLRSAAAGDTVWLELHGAGRDAEVAGVFVMGIEADRIRWARIYSALVEGAPATVEGAPEQPAPLREVPPLEDAAPGPPPAVGAPATGTRDEDPMASVVDIDGSGRSRRRRFRRKGDDGPVPDAFGGERAVEEDPVLMEAAAALASVPAPAEDDEAWAPSVAPADSIDPEHLVDADRLVDPGRVEPEVAAETEVPAQAGSDYDLEAHGALRWAMAEPDPEAGPKGMRHPEAAEPEAAPEAEPEPDVMVETMVAFVPDAAVAPDPLVDPEPEVLVERVIVEAPAEHDPALDAVEPEVGADLEPTRPASEPAVEGPVVGETPSGGPRGGNG